MTTEQLTKLISADPAAMIQSDREHYGTQILQAVDILEANGETRPVIFLAGPSGSGKTTTALLIERELERRGIPTHTLSMDDYFCSLTPEEIQLMRENKLDLEKPSRVDIPFFQQQLGELLAGKKVELPRYDFITSRRVFEGKTLQLKPGELVIMEGIHALNPEVTGYTEQTSRIYVSVRTRITGRNGLVLHPSKIRLARRLIRDRTGRNRPLIETISMKDKVDRGEQNYIMPFKKYAHCSVDSFYSCELSIYRHYLYEDLKKLVADFPELEDLVQIMGEVPDISEKYLPRDSLLREFIGGSELDY